MDGELTFGAWLKRRRRQLDLTQKALAHLAGCSVGTIRKMEADERKPSRQLGGLLAQQLDIPDDQHEAFIAFGRSEPYLSDVSFPVPDLLAEQIPVIPPEEKLQQIRHNLPAENTLFVGRESELAALEALFNDQDRRLVTIVGPGGIGKTRLALAYAAKQLENQDGAESHPYKDGVFFVDLASLAESERLTLTLAESLNLRIQGGGREKRSAKQQLIDFLLDQRLLLVLDNFEQLLSSPQNEKQDGPDSAAMLSEILGTALDVRILVTSRERLNLQIEQVYPLQGLVFPDREIPADAAAYSAMKLFLQSAQSVQPGFVLVADDWTYLTKICRLVEGMPLALELAATWVDVLSLADIVAEIQQSLDFLEAELRDLPPRHRSMRATFNNSWRKLNEREQAVFAQLSVFRGGFTRQAAQVVTGATLRQLSRLVNKSFIQFNQQQNRYQIHELMRQYGAEWLEKETELETGLQNRHSRYYCQMLGSYTDDLKGVGQQQAQVAIETDIENVQLAWNHAVLRQDLEAMGLSLESLHRFYWNVGRNMQGIREFERAVSGLRISDPVGERGIVLGGLLAFLGRFYWYTGQLSNALQVLQESLDLLQRLGAQKQRLMPLLFLAEMQETLEESASMYKESLALAREIGDQWAIGHALLLLGMNSVRAGEYEEAEQRYRQALAQFRQNGDMGGISTTLDWLSTLAVDRGRYQEALSLARESIEANPDSCASAYSLAQALYAIGRYAEAQELFQQGLVISNEMDDKPLISQSLFYLGEIAFQMGDYVRAEEEFRESLALGLVSDPWGFVERNHDALARLDMAQGEYLQARKHLQDALKFVIQLDYLPILLAIMTTAAELLAEVGDLVYAALLATFISNHPAIATRIRERAERLLVQLESQLPVDDLAEVRHRSRESDLDSLASQLLIDLERA